MSHHVKRFIHSKGIATTGIGSGVIMPKNGDKRLTKTAWKAMALKVKSQGFL